MRLLDLLVLGLSAVSVAEATFVQPRVGLRDVRAIRQRQEGEDLPLPSAAVSSTPAEPTASDPTSEPTTSPTPSPSVEPTPTPPSSTPPPINSPSSPAPQPSSPKPSSSKGTATTTPKPDPSEPPVKSSEPIVSTITRISTITYDDGTQSTLTSETLTTQTPGLAENKGNGGGEGMSTKTKNTVIGVVVGIGGAIILIGLGFVAWRIWGRKKNQDENDGLMDYTTPNDGKSEVGASMNGRTPFQSTLESYHAPTQVNQAANF